VCFVDEIWGKGLTSRKSELRVLSRFDHVFVGTQGSVESLAELTGRTCTYLPASVDAVALCPYPGSATRVIDMYWMGRRSAPTHQALLELARRERWFYLYDTLEQCNVPDPRAHRRHLAELLQRTRYFFAYTGKVNATEQTGGQQEIGSRYFEGAAAGTVMIGEPPVTPWFDKLFGWDDAVVRLPYDSTDPRVLRAVLDLDPSRERAIRNTNVVESLRRHDHVYRWAEVLRRVGLVETQEMVLRRTRLRELAEHISAGGEVGCLGVTHRA
jgi:hypothetical protein